MIQLQCSNCNTVLSIDDAFAGGVCRCQFCGTIQTVPDKGGGSRSDAQTDQPSPKPLYKRKGRIESALSPYSDSLEQVADQIPSSGLGNSALVNGVHRRSVASDSVPLSSQVPMSGIPMSSQMPMSSTTEAAQRQAMQTQGHIHSPATRHSSSRNRLLVAMAGGFAAIALGVGIWAMLDHKHDTPKLKSETPKLTSQETGELAAPTPSLAGVEFKGDTFVYLIDRSGCSAQVFQDMVRSCERSIETLGASRKFQVMVMNADHVVIYPKSGPANANTSNRTGLSHGIGDDVYLTQTRNTTEIFSKAIESTPDAIVLLSAAEQTPAFTETVLAALGKNPRPVYAFYVGSATSPGLSDLASATGGEYAQINLAAIK